jgi:hypothetical protein
MGAKRPPSTADQDSMGLQSKDTGAHIQASPVASRAERREAEGWNNDHDIFAPLSALPFATKQPSTTTSRLVMCAAPDKEGVERNIKNMQQIRQPYFQDFQTCKT